MPDSPPPQPRSSPYRMLVHPKAKLPEVASSTLSAAMDLQLDLLGDTGEPDSIDSRNAFLPLHRHRGVCRACGSDSDLSFEHMPPAAAGNSTRARGANSLGVLTSDDPGAFPRSGWFPSQKGMGAHVLCEPCNHLFGRRYVNDYVAFARDIAHGAIAAIRTAGFVPGTVDVDVEGWRLGDIAREGLVQLLDLGVHDRLIRRYPALSQTVLAGEGGLPPELRLGLTLVIDTARGRVCSPMLSVTDPGEPTEAVVLFSEVAMAPFAWTLSFVGGGRSALPKTADVSAWLGLSHGEVAPSTALALPVGTVGSAVPGDYAFRDVVRAR